MIDRKHQLYSLTGKTFQAPLYVNADGDLKTCAAENIPLVHWPDGSWCFEANRYIRQQFERGLSRHSRGGSLATFASQICHLLRYCWRVRTDPIALSDNQFCSFVGELISERDPRHPEMRARNNNSVIDIGRRCLSFLHSVGIHQGDINLVSPTGRIRATLKQYERPSSGGRFSKPSRPISYWDHTALPQPDPVTRRSPIAKEYVDALRKAAINIAHDLLAIANNRTPRHVTLHTRDRRLVVILLLETTGARRGEIALITVESVLAAQQMEFPMLRIPTLKKGKDKPPYRYVPIARHDLKVLADYIEFSRRPLIRKLLKGKSDHGFLLFNGMNGDALKEETITGEIKELAKYAKLNLATSPHQFRHRFITKLFVMLINQHQIENPDHFRRFYLESETLKRKISEWTGHSSLSSLDRYIHLAFDEIGNYKRVFNLVRGSMVVESALGTLDSEIEKMASLLERPEVTAIRIRGFLVALSHDLKIAIDESELRDTLGAEA